MIIGLMMIAFGLTLFSAMIALGLTLTLFSATRRPTPKPDARHPQPPWDPVFAALTDHKGAHCPDCGNEIFYYGPHGGACQNVMCANDDCGSRFNLAPFDDGWRGAPFVADRISEPSPLKSNPMSNPEVLNDSYKSTPPTA